MLEQSLRCAQTKLLGNPRNRPHHASHLQEYVVRQPAKIRCLARSPIETAHVLAKDHTVDCKTWRQNNLELVALHFA